MIWNTLKLRITWGPPLAPVDWMQTKKLHSRSSEDRTVSSSSTCNARFIPTIYCTQHLVVVFWKSHSSLLPPCGCTEEEQAVQSASVSILNQKSEKLYCQVRFYTYEEFVVVMLVHASAVKYFRFRWTDWDDCQVQVLFCITAPEDFTNCLS